MLETSSSDVAHGARWRIEAMKIKTSIKAGDTTSNVMKARYDAAKEMISNIK